MNLQVDRSNKDLHAFQSKLYASYDSIPIFASSHSE